MSQEVLDRLSRRSQGPECPRRQELVEQFCRAAGWQDAKGRLRLSSAAVALRRLEEQGRVQLPLRGSGVKRTKARRLYDDGQALPPLPALGVSGQRMSGLSLQLIRDESDPAHRIWNRLIAREHPLGDRPLVGSQLRYLIACDQGIVGAFGFGPPAYHLECRDVWIGWSGEARQQNLGRVIGLSRFLIRPALRVANLASQCYGLVLRQVGSDWQERYGSRPVLVETYVDRSHQQGRSLAAANWRRIGQSKGRGREDRRREHPKALKDVWVYELQPKARATLQATQPEKLAPRSVFAPALSLGWSQEEMDGVQLGDGRLNRGVAALLEARWKRPQNSFWRSFDSPAQAKAACRLAENPRSQISLQSLLAPHRLQTARRMAAETVVLLAQDTTTLSYNGLQQTQGLGTVAEAGSRGLFLHSLQAFRLDGIPLGTPWAEVWARSALDDSAQRNGQSVADKESGRWVRAVQAASRLAQQMPQTTVLACGDRESDFYELYDQKEAAPANLHLLARGQHDRKLSDGRWLKESLAQLPLGGTLEVQVPRRQGQPSRLAQLALRWQALEIQPPAVTLKRRWPALSLYGLWVCEVGAPAGIEPIQWLLLTTWPITTLKMARRLVRWYALRWGIECWHKVLKVVCGVERRQMKSAQALERALAFDMIIASRVLLLSRLGKQHPDLPATVAYSPEELAVLEVKKKETGKFCQSPKLTLLQANILTAMLVGFWGRTGDGHPGAQVLGEGLRTLQTLVWYDQQLKSNTSGSPRRRNPT